MITLHSSHGEATFDAATGELIKDGLDPRSFPDAKHPKRLDLEEFKRLNPDTEADGDFDILMFGYWTKDGTHCPAVWDHNAEELS